MLRINSYRSQNTKSKRKKSKEREAAGREKREGYKEPCM